MIPILVINLVFTLTVPGISIPGHLGGLVVGAAMALVLAYAPRGRRTLVQVAGGAIILAGAARAGALPDRPAAQLTGRAARSAAATSSGVAPRSYRPNRCSELPASISRVSLVSPSRGRRSTAIGLDRRPGQQPPAREAVDDGEPRRVDRQPDRRDQVTYRPAGHARRRPGRPTPGGPGRRRRRAARARRAGRRRPVSPPAGSTALATVVPGGLVHPPSMPAVLGYRLGGRTASIGRRRIGAAQVTGE